MKATRKSTRKLKHDLLIGTWFEGDDLPNEVEYNITRSGNSYAVQVCDRYDGELADIFETAWDGKVLSFAAHWNSTGRFARYRLLLISANSLDVTYTYTDNVMYHRKSTK